MSEAARLEAIFISPARGDPVRRVALAAALAGAGLEGDRYALGTGYYSGRHDCQISLIEAEVLDAIHQEDGLPIHDGQHRRNLVTRGLRLLRQQGWRLRIGAVLLEYERPRPPCDYVQRLSYPGLTKALGRGAGLGMRILTGGMLEEGALIKVVSEGG